MPDNDFTARPDDIFVIGIDLGGTKIRGGIATLSGDIVADKKILTNTNGIDLVDQIVDLVADLCETIGARLDQVAATGIGGAGVPNQAGSSFDLAPNLTALDNKPFAQGLIRRLGHPVILENDVNVAAIGELHHGVGLNTSNFVFISVGTGIGMGIVANGQLVRGARSSAGEIGFLPFGSDELVLSNHVRGPLEEAVAGDALAKTYHASTGHSLSAQEIFARAAHGEPHAVAAVDHEAKWLATAIVAVRAVLDPEVFVLGGGIGSRADLLPPIQSWLTRLGAHSLDIRSSELGHRAPIAGAVRLALDAALPSLEGQPR
ncbi:ROK family protein [Cryobacterium mannosilyticum]|uniref:ROK family protein n=1 Tax=Cryobacterium mannosilyticum TaxID=1259190 RepID=A0A4R8W9B8_9MICO|nr:ROK family protein [Cryobacterium mannosilyticum]TFC05231.1 ROK family protein [Cryobacterium mannosilyticum]